MIEAIHEAGHAFAFAHYGVEVDYAALIVSEENRSEWGGYTMTPPHTVTVLEEAVCILAGPAAGSLASGEDLGGESVGDFQNLGALFDLHKIPPVEREELAIAALTKSKKLIAANWKTVLKIAAVLEDRKRIEGWEVKQIVEDAARELGSCSQLL